VWVQDDGSTDCNGTYCYQIYKSEYRAGSWAHPTGVSDYISPTSDGNQPDSMQPRVAMDNNGEALISWSQGSGNDLVYLSEYRSGSWNHPADINDSIGSRWHQELAMDDSGNAIVVMDSNGGPMLSEYRSGSWSQQGFNASFGAFPRPAMDYDGNAIIVSGSAFSGATSGGLPLYISEYRNGSWQHPADINDSVPFTAIGGLGTIGGSYQLAMDNYGNAIIVWSQVDRSVLCGSDYCEQIYKSEYR